MTNFMQLIQHPESPQNVVFQTFDFDVTWNQEEKSVLSSSDWSEWFIVMHWQLRREGIYE